MLKKSFFVSKGVLYPFFGFLHMDLIKMQIPLVESRLALSYSSWFSDLGFAFFVRWLQVSALFNLENKHGKIKEKQKENNNYFDYKCSACNPIDYITDYNGYRL